MNPHSKYSKNTIDNDSDSDGFQKSTQHVMTSRNLFQFYLNKINTKLAQLNTYGLDATKTDLFNHFENLQKVYRLIQKLQKQEQQNKNNAKILNYLVTKLNIQQKYFDTQRTNMKKIINRLEQENQALQIKIKNYQPFTISKNEQINNQKLNAIKQVYNVKCKDIIKQLEQKSESFRKIISQILITYNNLLSKTSTLNRVNEIEPSPTFKFTTVGHYSFTYPHTIQKEVIQQFQISSDQLYTFIKKVIQKPKISYKKS